MNTWVMMGWVALTTLGWLVSYARSIWGGLVFPQLDELAQPELELLPRLSVIVPACNEAKTIEPALRSLLEVDYPKLEIIAINDRSDDETGELIEKVAAEDDRVRPIHIEQLPEGWLGKTHALHRGAAVATGEWLLFTDADVHYEPGALEHAVGAAIAQTMDHLTLVPDIHTHGLLGSALYETFGMLLLLSTRLDRVSNPGTEDFMGIGAFNLVRAEVFERSEGFERIRMEIADDFGLAMVINEAGGRTGAAYAPDDLSLEWYPSMGAMIRGLRKNAFAVMCRFSYVRAVAMVALMVFFIVGPFVGIAIGLSAPELLPWPWVCTALAVLATAVHAVVYAHIWDRPLLAQLLIPVGQLLVAWTMVRSAAHYWRNNGVDWRGTHYDLDELRDNQQVRI